MQASTKRGGVPQSTTTIAALHTRWHDDKGLKIGPLTIPGFAWQTAVLWFSFGTLFTVYYAGLAPYHSEKAPRGAEIFASSQTISRVSDWGDDTWLGPYIHNPFYTAGDRLSWFTMPARVLGLAFWPTTPITLVKTWTSEPYEDAAETLSFHGDDTSPPSGELRTGTNRPAYGKLQALAMQFTQVEALALQQTGTACGMNRASIPYEIDRTGKYNATLSVNAAKFQTASETFMDTHYTPHGGWYCKFLEERSANVQLWYRTISNSYRLGFWILCILMYMYALRLVLELAFWIFKPKSGAGMVKLKAPHEHYLFHVYAAYTLTAYGAETIWLEEFLMTIIIAALVMVRVCTDEFVAMAVTQGPDVMGYLAKTGNGTLFTDANNVYSQSGLHPGQAFMSLDVLDEAQNTATTCLILMCLHIVVRGLFYYPSGTFFSCTRQMMNSFARGVFGNLVPHHWSKRPQMKNNKADWRKAAYMSESGLAVANPANMDPHQINSGAEVANQPCSLLCFLPCLPCNTDGERMSCFKIADKWFWFLRGNMRYSIFVLVTVIFAFTFTMLITPALYVDGLRSQYLTGEFWPGARTSLSLAGSRSEAGGYCLADVIGYLDEDERTWTSARRNAYQDFHGDLLDEHADAQISKQGLTFEMYTPLTLSHPMKEKDDVHAMTCSFCSDSLSDANPRIPLISEDGITETHPDRVNSPLIKRTLRMHAPQVMGLSVYLRYNAQLADTVISTAMRFGTIGFYIVVVFSVCGMGLMRYWSAEAVGMEALAAADDKPIHKMKRITQFFLQNLGEIIGHSLIIGSMLIVIFMAVRPAEITRDTLIDASTSGVQYMSATSNSKAGVMDNGFGDSIPGIMGVINQYKTNKFLPANKAELNAALPNVSALSYLVQPYGVGTVWQQAVAMGMDGMATTTGNNDYLFDEHLGSAGSSAPCADSHQPNSLPGAYCTLGKLSFFRDKAFGTLATIAENHEGKRETPYLLDATWRSMCRPSTSYFYNQGSYKVNEMPRLSPEFQNDIRFYAMFIIFMSVCHVFMYSLLFVPLLSFNYPRRELQAYLDGTYGLSLNPNRQLVQAEMTPLLNGQAQVATAYQPTLLRMTGMPAKLK